MDQIAEEKGISKEKILETIEMAIAAAYKKDFGRRGQIIRAEFDPSSGETKVFRVRLVVDESTVRIEEETEEDEGFGRPQDAVRLSEVGFAYAKVVIDAFRRDIITMLEACDHLNVRADVLDALETRATTMAAKHAI